VADNIIIADFSGGRCSVTARRKWQYDRNQYLMFTGIEDLPGTFPVHFSNSPACGETIAQIGTAEGGVLIPDQFFWSGENFIYAFLYLHTNPESDETVYTVTIPLSARPKPSDVEPSPQQEDVIGQTIAALNDGVERAETAASNAAQSSADAETAQTASEAARDRAEQARDDAAESAVSAAGSAGSAEGSAIAAARSATEAAGSAADAHRDADRAEQAAATSGYLWFDIHSDGHLYLDRTPNTQVDFYLSQGHLYVEG
jgi:pyruvate/2-oxoglutarate dehydrogenase complex dihydrolipoamide acyltransferase (E2) component